MTNWHWLLNIPMWFFTMTVAVSFIFIMESDDKVERMIALGCLVFSLLMAICILKGGNL